MLRPPGVPSELLPNSIFQVHAHRFELAPCNDCTKLGDGRSRWRPRWIPATC